MLEQFRRRFQYKISTHLLDLGVEGIQVDKEINASLCKRVHAAAVVGTGVNVVNADAIYA